jgi:hypothetical protein
MLAKTGEDWVKNTAKLLQDVELRQTLTDRAWKDFASKLSTQSAAGRLAEVLGQIRK